MGLIRAGASVVGYLQLRFMIASPDVSGGCPRRPALPSVTKMDGAGLEETTDDIAAALRTTHSDVEQPRCGAVRQLGGQQDRSRVRGLHLGPDLERVLEAEVGGMGSRVAEHRHRARPDRAPAGTHGRDRRKHIRTGETGRVSL